MRSLLFSVIKFFPGGIESMAITEVFGGELSCIHIAMPLCRHYLACRISNWENSTVSHTLWYVHVVLSLFTCSLVLLTVTTQLPGANGYTGGKVVFVDTEVKEFTKI